jgi:hypothetical protein
MYNLNFLPENQVFRKPLCFYAFPPSVHSSCILFGVNLKIFQHESSMTNSSNNYLEKFEL